MKKVMLSGDAKVKSNYRNSLKACLMRDSAHKLPSKKKNIK